MIPIRYRPLSLTRRDRKLQTQRILKSRRNYRRHRFEVRKPVASFHSRPSRHVRNAMKLYSVDSVRPTRELSTKTGCSIATLKKIINKGEGAYYSSGSRPNQTAESWGLARLASAITGGNASLVDKHLIQSCDPSKPAYKRLTQKMRNA